MGTRWRTLYSGRGRARHHSGISARENRTGTERAKKARDPRRNGCLIETETARCIVWRTINDTHDFTLRFFRFSMRNVSVFRYSIQNHSLFRGIDGIQYFSEIRKARTRAPDYPGFGNRSEERRVGKEVRFAC